MNATVQARNELRQRVAQIIVDSGGEIVGRTRLQKTAYLLSLAGFEDRFRFGYKYYGPFSETLADTADLAAALGIIDEQQKPASWGGSYSVYRVSDGAKSADPDRVRLTKEAAQSDAILLELAATAAYLFGEHRSNPWVETANRKADKASDGRLDRAKELYRALRMASNNRLPDIP